MTTERSGWLELVFDVPAGAGVDARNLADVLRDFSAAARVVAGDYLSEPDRRGPPSPAERMLSALRVVSVQSGSLIIEFAPPDVGVGQAPLLGKPITASDIALEVLEGMAGPPVDADQAGITRRYRAFERLRRSARRIAPGASARLRHPDSGVRSFVIGFDSAESRPLREPEIRQRTMFGHVFMADVESGRQRLRVKLPDGSDHTLSVDLDLIPELNAVLNRVVELDVSEARIGGEVVERVVGAVRVLEPSETGNDQPAQSVDDLARQQGLAMQPIPDYFALVDALLEDEEEVERFAAHLTSMRSG